MTPVRQEMIIKRFDEVNYTQLIPDTASESTSQPIKLTIFEYMYRSITNCPWVFSPVGESENFGSRDLPTGNNCQPRQLETIVPPKLKPSVLSYKHLVSCRGHSLHQASARGQSREITDTCRVNLKMDTSVASSFRSSLPLDRPGTNFGMSPPCSTRSRRLSGYK